MKSAQKTSNEVKEEDYQDQEQRESEAEEMIKKWIKTQTGLNDAPLEPGEIPVLHLACMYNENEKNRITIVEQILDKKADPNRKSMLGNTPLMYASLVANERTAKLLIEAKADPSLTNTSGCTEMAARRNCTYFIRKNNNHFFMNQQKYKRIMNLMKQLRKEEAAKTNKKNTKRL